jgi:hypothetical protein
MVSLISPGIETREIDLSTVVPSVTSLEGAIAGVFQWGPVGEPIKIASEVDLVRRFGGPKTGFNTETFFTAADFLAYSNALFVVRVSDGEIATDNDGSNTAVTAISAKYPGSLGNSLKVEIFNSDAFGTAEFASVTTRSPSSNTNVHVVVVDELGAITGTEGAVLEIFEDLSIDPTSKTEDGTNNYLIDFINLRSIFINIDETATLVDLLDYNETLGGGSDGSSESTIALAELYKGYDLFESAENIDISLIMQGKPRGTANQAELAQYILDNVVLQRRDCVLFVSPDLDTILNNPGDEATRIVQDFRNNINNNSYTVMDSGYKYRYDKYNDRYIYTPLNGDIAGLCVRTDRERDPWFSPAGYNRGLIKNVVKLAWNPKKADRDTLYKGDVNPVFTQAGEGTLLFGDKTLLGRQSAFSRINVRRLFIILQKSISRAARTTLFEFNDDFTRRQFVNIVEPFLRDVQGRRGVTDFRVVCDETNNTPEVIDRNEFIGDIYIKPARAINFIQLNFVAVRTGVEFFEVVGQF